MVNSLNPTEPLIEIKVLPRAAEILFYYSKAISDSIQIYESSLDSLKEDKRSIEQYENSINKINSIEFIYNSITFSDVLKFIDIKKKRPQLKTTIYFTDIDTICS